MSLRDCRGVAYAFHRFMVAAQRDIDQGGEIKPAKVLYRRKPKLNVRTFFRLRQAK